MVLNLDNGIPVDQIAGLKPDLIVAINAGVDADTYQKLSAIAPTIAQSDGDAFFEPWKDQATAIGQAVFQADQMKSLIDAVDQKFAAVAQKNPQWQGQEGAADAGPAVAGHRGRHHGGLADRLPEADGPGHHRQHQTASAPITAPSSRAITIKAVLDSADVVIWTTESPDDRRRCWPTPRWRSQATAQNRHIFTTKDQAGAIAFASPLSYPMVADQLPAADRQDPGLDPAV